MPADSNNGLGKLLVIGAGALLFGVAIGVVCIFASASHGDSAVHHGAHKERSAFLRHGNGDTLVVDTKEADAHRVAHGIHEEQERREKRNESQPELNHTEHNLTNLTNRTNLTKEDVHEHKHCHGGPEAACECMLKCKVFGADPSQCDSHIHNHSETRRIVDNLIAQTMMSHKSMCEGMRCVTECARSLGCLDGKVVEDCHIVKQNYNDNKKKSDPHCDLSCDIDI